MRFAVSCCRSWIVLCIKLLSRTQTLEAERGPSQPSGRLPRPRLPSVRALFWHLPPETLQLYASVFSGNITFLPSRNVGNFDRIIYLIQKVVIFVLLLLTDTIWIGGAVPREQELLLLGRQSPPVSVARHIHHLSALEVILRVRACLQGREEINFRISQSISI